MKKNIFILILLITVSACVATSGLNHSLCYGLDKNSEINVIRVGFDPNLPPYQYYENGQYLGLNIELINKIAENGNIKIELIPMPLNECIQEFNKKNIQMILGIRYKDSMKNIMEFSDSLVESRVSIIMLKDREEQIKSDLNVEPLIIAVEKESTEFEFVKNIKKANYNVAYNQESVIELLLMNRADMMIGVKHVAEHILDKYDLSRDYTISNTYETPVDYYIGVNIEIPGLLNIINHEIRELKLSGDYEKIYNKWINDKNLERQKQIVQFLTVFLSFSFFIIIGTALFSFNLKRKVNEKTIELVNINSQLEDKITEIRQSNELKNLIIESSPRSIVIFDNDGKISMINDNLLNICRLTQSVTGESIFDLVPVNMMLEGYIDSVLNDGKRYMGLEMDYHVNDRDYIFRYAIYPLFDYDNKTRGAIITIEDVTDEKKLLIQAEEKEKNRVLSQIISGIAHEIRNPLTSIKTYIELLPKKKDNIEFQKQIVNVVPHEVERVDSLISQLIDYSKPKVKNAEIVLVSDLIESCVLLFKPVLDRNNISLNLNLDEDIYVKIDRNQIKQVMINLLLNSIDAIREKEEMYKYESYNIEINGILIEDNVIMSVKDNGIGMTKNELKNVYDLFYTTKANGTGMGLPLSKQIVEENGGSIKIESEKYKQTKITISFPKFAKEKPLGTVIEEDNI